MVREMAWKKGDRVRLIRCNDEYTELQPGTEGTISLIDDFGTIHVDWDNGSRLGMVEEYGDEIAEAPFFPGFNTICKICNCDIVFTVGLRPFGVSLWFHVANDVNLPDDFHEPEPAEE